MLIKSSHKNNDFNSCNMENSKNNCTICDDNKQRILLSISPSKCICKDGYFDDGIEEECKMCY